PANIMLRADDEPVIMDFGLARAVTASQRLTNTGVLLGTPSYMSPEQVRGDKSVGKAADIYALGVILYELITGAVPFTGPGYEVFAQILHGTLTLPSELRPGVDRELDAMCQKAMAREPEQRYGTMAQLAAALQGYVQFRPRDVSTGPATEVPGILV